MFKTKIVTLFSALMLISTFAVAGTDFVNVSKLTPEQRAELQLKVVQLEQSGAPVDTAVKIRTETEKWAELGTNVSSAVVAGAKGVGLAANEFAQTPLGKITTAVVIYKFLGRDIIHFVVGSLILFLGMIASYLWYRWRRFESVEYENIPRLGGLWVSKKMKSFYFTKEIGELYFGSAAFFVGGITIGTLIMFG